VRFRDRGEAGRRLARVLSLDPLPRPVVLAIPRGGVPISASIAAALGCPWDVAVVRKLAFPWNPELGFGAVALDGTTVRNDKLLDRSRLTPADVERVRAGALREAERRDRVYRGGRPLPNLAGRSIVLTDDGLASGYTMLAAVESVRKSEPLAVVVAAPVASDAAVTLLRPAVDRLVILHASDTWSFAVADFYDDFSQLVDGEVLMILEASDLRLSSARQGVSG
jgi:putative phosphoribosyl transferase